MKHAEAIAERLFYLGGRPRQARADHRGRGAAQQLRRDLADEEGALELYRRIVIKARDEGDVVTEDLFKGILADEEDHHDTFQGLIEQL